MEISPSNHSQQMEMNSIKEMSKGMKETIIVKSKRLYNMSSTLGDQN